MLIRHRKRKPVEGRRSAQVRLGVESLEGRQLLAVLSLQSAQVRADGRIVELTFRGPATDGAGIAEHAPGAAEGMRLTTSLGTALEPLGTVVTTQGTDLIWKTSYLVSNAKQVITFGTANVIVSAPDHLIRDDHGNWSAAFDATADNQSMVDSNGFSTSKFTRGIGGVTLYVSSTYGDDTRSFSQAQKITTPYKTLAAAMTALRSNNQDGKGSAVRLLRGDTFTGGATLIGVGGQDPQHPMVIEDYWYNYSGTATDPGTRPLIVSDWSNGVYNGLSFMLTSTMKSAGKTLNYVVVRRLEFRAINRNTDVNQQSTGLNVLTGGRGWLLDDLVLSNYQTNLNLQGYDFPFQDATILRSTMIDAHLSVAVPDGVFAGAQGMYASNNNGLLISQSVFDRNGRSGADLAGRNVYSHNIYLQSDSGPATVWGNVIRAGGSHGIQMRSGGILAYNYLARNAIAADMMATGGVMTHNIVENAEDINSTSPRGYGLVLSTGWGSSLAAVVEQNIVLNSSSTTATPLYYWQRGTGVIYDGAFRNNTAISAGGFKIGMESLPSVPHTISVYGNAIDAGAMPVYGIGVDYPSWFDWLQSDRNIYNSSATLPFVVGGPPHDQTLSGWTALTGEDPGSAFGAIKFPSAVRIGNFSASLGLGATETDYINALRSRGRNAWPAANDMLRLFAYYGSKYQVQNRSDLGSGAFDYQGAIDYRPAAPDLQSASDTGPYNSDNITRNNTGLKFDVRNTISGYPLELLRNGVVVATGTGNSLAVVTLTDSGTLADGTYTYAVRTTGRDGVKILGPSLLITVDRTPPDAPDTPALMSLNGLIPLFSVTASTSTDRVQLLRRAGGSADDYVVVGTRTGTGLLADSTISAAGDYEYVVRLVDLAGNVGSYSNSLRIVI
jgi:hypothetical protein